MSRFTTAVNRRLIYNRLGMKTNLTIMYTSHHIIHCFQCMVISNYSDCVCNCSLALNDTAIDINMLAAIKLCE